MDTPDTTATLERKIQTKLRGLKKEGKLDDKTYKDAYPSGSITPTANPAIKAHKANKDYPARLITSHIGAPQESLAALINNILKTYIENSPYVCKNSFEFAQKMKQLKLRPHTKMISFDATALFPSVPIADAIRHILELLETDETLHKRTSLSPYDIVDLIDICLSSSNFVYDGRHHTTENSGPIGLSLMVTVSQIWMIYTIGEAVKIAKNRGCIVPQNIEVYVDDCWATILDPPPRTGLRNDRPRRDPAAEFQECLNAVHPRVQFTREEETDKSIAFLDCLVTRHDDGTISTTVYRKPSNTNIAIKPQSCQDPKTAISAFKGELCRCHRLSSSPELARKSIEFVLDLYEDNGHDREKLKKIADEYQPPSRETGGQSNKNQQKATKVKSPQNQTEKATSDLFNVLPFFDCDFEKDYEDIMFACIPYIPGISHQLKRALGKAGINTTFTSAPKLKDILCSRNTTKPPPEKKKGIYKYQCPCNDKSIYIGQTGRSYEIRWDEHKKATNRQQWQHSGITQHYQHCPQRFNEENFSVIHNMQGKNKRRLGYEMRMREALEIRKHKCGPGKGLNEDMGAYVKTDIWDTVLNSMG